MRPRFRVRSFSIAHVSDAIDVRGVPEGSAAGLVAGRASNAETEKRLPR